MLHVPLHTDAPADPAWRRTIVRRFDLHTAIQVHRALTVLVVAEGFDGQRQQGRPLLGEHGRDLPLGGAMDARVGPARFPVIQGGLRLLGAFEAHALQRGLLRMAHAALDLPLGEKRALQTVLTVAQKFSSSRTRSIRSGARPSKSLPFATTGAGIGCRIWTQRDGCARCRSN